MAIGKYFFPLDEKIISMEAIVGGSSNIPLYVPVKLDVNAAGYGAAMVKQIPYIIQCTSPTDDGYIGILYPAGETDYTWNSSTGFYEAAPADKVAVARVGSICMAMLDSGASINTTSATYGPYVSADTNGVDASAAGNFVAGKLMIEATGYAGASGHFALIEVLDGLINGNIPAIDESLQNLTGNGAITFTAKYNICKLTKNTVIAATVANGTATDVGKIITAFDNGTGAAHTITFQSGKLNSTKTTITLGGATDDYASILWTGTYWQLLGSKNATLS